MTIRVLVVGDSSAVRLALANSFRALPAVVSVAVARDGAAAVESCQRHAPDLVTVEMDMPGMDGVRTIEELRKVVPAATMVLFAGSSGADVGPTLGRLGGVAVEFVVKPDGNEAYDLWFQQNLAAIVERASHLSPPVGSSLSAPTALRNPMEGHGHPLAGPPGAAGVDGLGWILVAASTGGPAAVRGVLERLHPDVGMPVLIVQHMPPSFTEAFAASLDSTLPWTVREARDGVVPAPGEVWVARGGRHMRVRRRGREVELRLDDGPPVHACRPAADTLFRSAVAEGIGPRCIVVILTGMGRDGCDGAALLHATGSPVVAQDEATSVVWGMPGGVVQAGITTAVLPLPLIGPYLEDLISSRRPVRGSFAPAR